MSGAPRRADEDPWASLTWDDLDQWVGATILARGRRYQSQGRVLALARASDGTLVGRVVGTELYTTRVTCDSEDPGVGLSANCSCPYGINCKHGVAIVLEYLERLRSGSDVPDELPDSLMDEHAGDEGDYSGADEELAAAEDEFSDGSEARTTSEYLEGLSKPELIDLVKALAAGSSGATKLVQTRARSSQGDVDALAQAARRELARAAAQPGWCNSWTGDGFTPDYRHVATELEGLLAAGEADLVLELGQEVLETGIHHVEESDDEGETASEISKCLTCVWQALSQSSLDPAQRILWLVDRLLEDEYDLCCESNESEVWEADAATWSQVADAIVARLDAGDLGPLADRSEWGRDYRRERLADWAIDALDKADRGDEALALCLREAPVTNSYQRAVERLMAAGRFDEARRQALEGISRTETEQPGIADTLRGDLQQIAAQQGDVALAAAFVAHRFFQRPSRGGYCDLRDAAQQTGTWPEVCRLVLRALTTGEMPTTDQGWPLPETDTPLPDAGIARSAPRKELLTEIALEEGDHGRALKWYRQLRRDRSPWSRSISERVASAIASSFPDESVAIWRDLASEAIARVNRRGYEEALRHLRPMRELLTSLGRRDEWESYLAGLRAEHRRKRALLQTLERLAERPIIDG